nr:ankyrin repeat-containing protein [Cedratvirus lena]WIL04841.1 ankyrin repeat-containing protein [Cedratvirus duvanny]
MEYIYENIFSFSGGYNYLNRQVCSEFRQRIKPFHFLSYLDEVCSEGREPEIKPSEELFSLSLKGGYLYLLIYCKEFAPKDLCILATRHGHLHILQWAREAGYDYDRKVSHVAAQFGHKHILNHLKEDWSASTCAFAARGGQLETLRYLISQGCDWGSGTCTLAARGGHLEVLQWAESQGCLFSTDIFEQAVTSRSCNVQVLSYLQTKGLTWRQNTLECAVKSSSLAILQWLKEQGCPLTVRVFKNAVTRGSPSILVWLVSCACPWNEEVSSQAALLGRFTTLKYLRKQDCPWNRSIYTFALRGLRMHKQRKARGLDKDLSGPQIKDFINIMCWAREQAWFYRLAIKFYIRRSLI